MSTVGREWAGRTVAAFTVDELRAEPFAGVMWTKPSGCKVEGFPAAPRTYSELVQVFDALDLPGGTVVEFCAEDMAWSLEFRCLVLDGYVAAVSHYLRYGVTYYDDPSPTGMESAAGEFAADFLYYHDDALPPACTLDVGWGPFGWAVIEANPGFSSAWYGCDPGVAAAVAAASSAVEGDHAWIPDPWLVRYAAARPALPVVG
jgi:hypothetical protein